MSLSRSPRSNVGKVWLWAVLLPAAALAAQEPSPGPSPAAPALPPVVARYEQMLATSPTKGTAFDKVYQYFFEGEGVDALDARWRARAAAGGPNAPAFLLLDGLLAERRAKPDEARTLYQQYTAAHPEDPRGWTALGELETAEGRFRASAEALARALAPEARPPVPPSQRPTLYRELARAQTRDFLGAAALATWRKLAAEFPDDPAVLQEVGEAFQEGESYTEARETFETLRELARKNGDAFGRINATLRLGQIEEARGHAKEAVGIYEGVVADSKPGSWLEREARARIEQLYRGQEDLPGLADYYKKWLDDHPKDVEVATRRAAVLVELNRKDQAIDLLREAVAWAPNRQELQVELARRLDEVNRPAEAVAVMEKLTVVAPEEKSYWQLLGDARWQALDVGPDSATMPPAEKARLKAAALDAWSHLSPPDSKDAVATGQLADLLASHRLVDEALAQYARAAALAPDLPDTRERWAAYLVQIKRRDEARAVLAGMVTADPKNATAANYARLATALDRLDDTDGALDATAKGLALEPRNFDLLSLRWQLLTAAKKWGDAVALYPALIAAAPNAYFADQVQVRHVSALAAAGKLAEVRKTLAARLGAAPPATPLDENELALLIRADFQSGGSDTDDPAEEAKRALAEGRARFPRSVSLLRLEGEGAKRARDPVAQVAVLRRLIDLQPQQKTDGLQEIARVWEDAGRLDDALAAARELVAASPANAASYLVEANLLLQANYPDEGLARLREAVRLSEKPNDVRLRLARTEADLGHAAQARAVLDEAFEAATDAKERLTLMKPLAEAYQRENRLDELIARFQHLQQAEADGWRYALYLAEIYQGVQDYGGARRELAKALAARPRDGALLRQLVRLSTEEQNAPEVARYQALLTEAEPSDSNKLALVQALLDNGQSAEGLNALRTHLAAILKIPGAWNQLLPQLARNDLVAQAGALLDREMGGPGADAKDRFTLALFQAVAGNLDQAKNDLWAVFAAKSPHAPVAPLPAAPAVASVGSYYGALYSGSGNAQKRYDAGVQTQNTAQNFLADGGRSMGRSRNYYGSGGGAQASGPSPTDTARDAALIYLAAIALKESAAVPFLAELDRRLDARDSSREDRLVAYALVSSLDPLLRQMAAQVASPEPDLDAFCLTSLIRLASMNAPSQRRYYPDQPAITDAQATKMEAIFNELLPRLNRILPPASPGAVEYMRYSFLKGLERNDQAEVLRQSLLAQADENSSPEQLETAIQLLMAGSMPPPEQEKFKQVCRALIASSAKSPPGSSSSQSIGQSYYYYPIIPWQQDSPLIKLPPAELAQVVADLLSLWYPGAPPPPSAGAGTSSSYRYNNGSPRDEGYLPPNRYLDASHVQVLRQLAQNASGQPELLAQLDQQLDQQAKDLPAPVRIYPRLVAAYLAAANGDKARALAISQALLAEQPKDDDLRLLTGLLQGRNGQPAEAVTTLSAISGPHSGDTAMAIQQLILLNAKAAKDTDSARGAALKLTAMRLQPEERAQLAADLRELGVNDKADQLAHIAATTPPSSRGSSSGRPASIFDYQTANQIQTLVNAKNNDAALTLIRNVLAALPPPPTNNGNDGEYVTERAVSLLEQIGKRDELIGDAEKQLAKAPDSLSLNYQLAILTQRNGGSDTREKRPNGRFVMPLWVKLTRADDTVTGWYSGDGERWQEIDHVTIPLGDAPLAALVAATSQSPSQAINATVDHVALTPDSAGTSSDGANGPLPAPWKETLLPTEHEKTNTVPPSTWDGGTFTLRAAGWDLWNKRDDARLVHRPSGDATEFVAHVVSLDGPGAESKTGVMWRASIEADSPYAAVIVLPGGGLSFQHRDRANRSTEYWRKVVALRPKEIRYGRALARNLAGRGQQDEAIAIFDGLVATNPDEAFDYNNDLREIYGKRLPELADRLLAWRPAQNTNRRNSPGYTFSTVADACAEQHQPEKVIALCRRGIELDSASGGGYVNNSLFERLLTTLVEQKRTNEARDALLACYLPPSAGSNPSVAGSRPATPQLGFHVSRYQGGNNWMSSASWSSTEINLSNLTSLETGRKAGLLDGLQDALEKRRSEDPARFATDGFPWLLALVQLDRRDPAVLDGLPALFDQPAGGANYRGNDMSLIAVRMEAARRLRRWPGHEALSLEAYRSAAKIAAGLARRQGSSYSEMPTLVGLQEAAVELSLGDPAAATVTLHEVVNGLAALSSSGRSRDKEYTKICLNLLLRAGPGADAAYVDLYNKSTETEQGKKDFYFAYGLEKNQRVGDNPHFQALAWLLDDGAGGDDATLVYELRPQHPYDKSGYGRYAGSRGRSFAGSEGERTLTFSYGSDAEHFAPIGQLQTASTFGTWKGPVPRGGGILKVTIDAPRPVDAEALAAETAAKESAAAPAATASPSPAAGSRHSGNPPPGDYWLRIVRTANLLANPGFEGLSNRDAAPVFSLAGWTGLPDGFWKHGTFESPLPGRAYVQCDLSSREETTITGARIPVEAGHAYFQSAWLRDSGNGNGGSVHFGRRYLDADGKTIRTSECPDFTTLIWQWHAQRLQLSRNGSNGDDDVIPAKTAFIEPFIRVRGAVSWTGLFVGQAD